MKPITASKQAFFIQLPIFLINSVCWVVVRLHAKENLMKQSLFQNSVSFSKGSKSKVAFSKTEVLKKPQQNILKEFL